MGKKRIVSQSGTTVAASASGKKSRRSGGKKVSHGELHIQATYNNTKVALHDSEGNLLLWSSSGSLGFKGAKKGTTFAAGKVGERLAEQAVDLGLKEADVVIKGVGAGREAALRSFAARGIDITSIRDITPVPFNGPRPRKPRRV